nr:hypothetical protein CFP56_08840 [Quercus suber]
MEVGQVEKLSFEMVNEARLERVIVGLTLSETEVVQSLGPTLLTKAWKRLAREVGMVTKDKTSDNGTMTVDNIINSRKKPMSIDFEDHMESKKVADDTKVSFLIDQDRFAWKEWLVTELFLPHEADIILGIPLSFRRPPDRIAWAHTPSGIFSTSSAYILIVSGSDFYCR